MRQGEKSDMKTCLVVDDSRVIRKVARRIIEGFKFQCDEAADGAEALAYCRKKMPDAILLDRNMPVMNGIDFVKALRQEPAGSQPIIVFCTTENDVPSITEALRAGVDEYIMKPFDTDIVQSKFQQVGLIGE